MLGQVQDARILRDLHVQGKAGLEAVLPVDVEAEEVHIELLRLRLVEDPKNRRRLPRLTCPPPSGARPLPRRRTSSITGREGLDAASRPGIQHAHDVADAGGVEARGAPSRSPPACRRACPSGAGGAVRSPGRTMTPTTRPSVAGARPTVGARGVEPGQRLGAASRIRMPRGDEGIAPPGGQAHHPRLVGGDPDWRPGGPRPARAGARTPAPRGNARRSRRAPRAGGGRGSGAPPRTGRPGGRTGSRTPRTPAGASRSPGPGSAALRSPRRRSRPSSRGAPGCGTRRR